MEIFSDLLYYPIGWLYLCVRYRDIKKRKEILNDKYEGDYSIAGAQLMIGTFLKVIIALLVIFIFIVIGRTLFDLLK